MPTMHAIAGIDIGNGYTKARMDIDGLNLCCDLPSTVSYTAGTKIAAQPSHALIERLADQMEATFTSPSIPPEDEGRVFTGSRAIAAGDSQREFNLDDRIAKCDDPLSLMLALTVLAAGAIRRHWQATATLPSRLDVHASAALALPVQDYYEHHERYRQLLQAGVHHVHVHNFGTPVDVAVTFDMVTVVAEGVPAQYAIRRLDAGFWTRALDRARLLSPGLDPGYTAGMLAHARNVIGIDIGEGTTNYPVFADGQLVVESSDSIPKGYGTVLSNAMRGVDWYESRKDLADFMLMDPHTPAQAAQQQRTQQLIDEQVRIYARDLMRTYANIFRKIGKRMDMVTMYGGGLASMASTLAPQVARASNTADGLAVPVIVIDGPEARTLNRDGLLLLAHATSRR